MSLRKFGFDRGDKRKIYTGLYSGRIAWMFTAVIILIWTLQGIFTTGTLSFPFVVLSASLAAYWISYMAKEEAAGKLAENRLKELRLKCNLTEEEQPFITINSRTAFVRI